MMHYIQFRVTCISKRMLVSFQKSERSWVMFNTTRAA